VKNFCELTDIKVRPGDGLKTVSFAIQKRLDREKRWPKSRVARRQPESTHKWQGNIKGGEGGRLGDQKRVRTNGHEKGCF